MGCFGGLQSPYRQTEVVWDDYDEFVSFGDIYGLDMCRKMYVNAYFPKKNILKKMPRGEHAAQQNFWNGSFFSNIR